MNDGEIRQNIRKRRKSLQENKINFNKINNSNFQVVKTSARKSISLKKNPIFKSKKITHKNQQQKFISNNLNHNPISIKKFHHSSSKSFNVKFPKFKEEMHKNNHDFKLSKQRRFSFQSSKILNKKRNNFHSNKKVDNLIEKKILRNSICKLENNIKSVLNHMRNEIEQKDSENDNENDNDNENNIQEIVEKRKFSIRSFVRVKNKDHLEEINKSDSTFSIINIKTLKKSNSLVLSQNSKQKIFKKLRNKIKTSLKKKNKAYLKESIMENNTMEEEEESDHSIRYSLDPNGYFIIIYDVIILVVNFLNSIFIPLRIAKNEDIRGSNSFLNKCLLYLIDFIYLVDLFIGFFRGFYNHKMKYIRKNKYIIKNYLNGDFFFDLIEAIPINLIIRLRIFQQTYIICESYNYQIIFLKLLIIIKTFKIIKITSENKNEALNKLYDYLGKNYYFELFFSFMKQMIVCIIFSHLFICLHIFFAMQSYPNWIIHINIINEKFLTKYITSFYFLLTTMTTVGYGDIVCISSIERIFHIILLAIGTIIYTFLVSKIGSYLGNQSHEQTKLDKDLNILESIRISNPTMPFKLYYKIKVHLINISKQRKKHGLSFLINGIPETLKNNLLYHIYSKVIKEFSVFKNVKNSSFILQMLSSFIPLISKKEEILILEGEFIDKIIFVKDGRLVIEIVIDLNGPYKSIQKYLEYNFEGISKENIVKEIKNNNEISQIQNMINSKKINYNVLKAELDNFLLQKDTKINNSASNNVSDDFGGIDFTKNEKYFNRSNNYEIIKIFDIRKNEHFGDVHMFLKRPSPFTLKTKSRIVELLLLKKNDAVSLSNNYPNIWRDIHNKSYHNLVSIKKLTFKILKRYYNTNFYNKKNNNLKFEYSTNSMSFIEGPSVINKNFKKYNNSLKSNQGNKSIRIPFNNNLQPQHFVKRKSSAKALDNDAQSDNNDSFISKTVLDTKFNISQSLINIEDNNIILHPQESGDFRKSINISDIKNKTTGIENIELTFKKTIGKNTLNAENNKSNIFLDLNYCNNNGEHKLNSSIIQYNELIKSINDDNNSNNIESMINGSKKFQNKSTKKLFNYPYEKEKIFTLNDINEILSKKIRKKIRKKLKIRKKIEKIKHSFELEQQENSKNLIELYANIIAKKLDPKNPDKLQNNLCQELIDVPIPSSNNKKEIFQLLESTSSEEYTPKKFNINSLKMSSISFEIKSSYNNINLMTKGEIIKNSRFKRFIENLIKKNAKKKFYTSEKFKSSILKTSEKFKKNKKKEKTILKNKTHKFKMSSLNPAVNLTKKNKSSTNIEMENYNSSYSKKNGSEEQSIKNEEKKTNDNADINFFKRVKEKKNFLKIKNLEIPIRLNNSTKIDNKSFTSSINIFKEYDKDAASKNENNLEILNKTKHNNLDISNYNDLSNINSKKSNKNCTIF